jgi:hypothetical protein
VHFGFSLDFPEVSFVVINIVEINRTNLPVILRKLNFADHFRVKEAQVECRVDSLANFHPLHQSDPKKSA